MGSADLMPRNLDSRVELVAPVEDAGAAGGAARRARALLRRQRQRLGARRRRAPGRGSTPGRTEPPQRPGGAARAPRRARRRAARRGRRLSRAGARRASLGCGAWRASRSCPAIGPSSTSSSRPARTPLHAARLLDQMMHTWPDDGGLSPRDPQGRAGGRPDHPRHHQAAQLDLRHADRPRGHLRPGDPDGRHRRLHRGGRRLPRPLQDRGADGAGAGADQGPGRSPASSSPRGSSTCPTSRTSTSTGSRSTGSRTRATGSPATPSPRSSPTGSTRWS